MAILIENKVAAAEQDRQDERYHLRAVRSQNEGKFDAFVTCICAPQRYLETLPAASLYQTRIAYEQIRDWFTHEDEPRCHWRFRIMDEAIEQGRRGYKMVVNQTVSDFHLEFWHYLQRHHPQLVMRRPTPKGNKSNWILFKSVDSPRGVGFHVKLDQQCVELGFQGPSVSDILAIQPTWPDDVRVIQKGKTAAVMVRIPFLDRMKRLEQQHEQLRITIQAVTRLLRYVQLFSNVSS
ncbi:MAG: PD-(D/E)XK nuclease family protein [Alphaproteobacteria bacterium]|nr:PD-(D/E)XK nuclease family protein [Alphaproteobacteria bacterium]MBV9371085.1 PD-(D/E)XK nuclease family protein [Alphaproteobacteria bacterium]MBV9901541.1 PD-(D/E)XK nuclease family protein [Alphaproteobacteria bacterium]